jgi:hypothetical protein
MTDEAAAKPRRFARLVATEQGGAISESAADTRSMLSNYFAGL